MQGRPRRLLGTAGNEIRDGLSLRQVQLVVEKRALRKLARLGKARTELDSRINHHARHDRPAEAMQLEHGLARERTRRREIQRDATIELLARGITECTVGGETRFR